MPIHLIGANRLAPVWVAIDRKGKILGRVPHREFCRELHAYVDRMERGEETRWPPPTHWNLTPCRFEIMFPPAHAQKAVVD